MSNDKPFDVSRRQLLRGTAAVAAASVTGSALAHCTGGGDTLVDAGAVTDYAVGTYQAVGNVIVGRDAMGLFAYSALCTHQQCLVPIPTNTLSTCPCHLSHFDGNGNVQPGGMATRDLAHFAVTINSGHVMVDTTMTLPDRTTRTPV
jgi:Rieske Fe-S protein